MEDSATEAEDQDLTRLLLGPPDCLPPLSFPAYASILEDLVFHCRQMCRAAFPAAVSCVYNKEVLARRSERRRGGLQVTALLL